MRTYDIQSELFYSFVRPRLERTSSDNGQKPESIATAILFWSSHAHRDDNHHFDSSGDTTMREPAASAAKHIVSMTIASWPSSRTGLIRQRTYCAIIIHSCAPPFCSYKSWLHQRITRLNFQEPNVNRDAVSTSDVLSSSEEGAEEMPTMSGCRLVTAFKSGLRTFPSNSLVVVVVLVIMLLHNGREGIHRFTLLLNMCSSS